MQAFEEDSEMFRDLLNRVKTNLVRTYLKYGIWHHQARLTDYQGRRRGPAKFLRILNTKY
jgi:hypothetical protein